MSGINKERLLKLADFLETVPAEKFSLGAWEIRGSCGFAGCAIGWAAHAHVFPGLSLTPRPGLWSGNPYAVPSFEGRENWDAVEHLFGLDEDGAEYLFRDIAYKALPTPEEVAERCRAYVSSGGVTP